VKKFLVVITAAAIALCACFALGVFDGDGISRVADKEYTGFVFSGNLLGGLFYGHGEIRFWDGDRFEGDFTEGRFDGDGFFSAAADRWEFRGDFHNGRVIGGTLLTRDREPVTLQRSEAADVLSAYSWRFEGGWGEYGQSGAGTFVFADGSAYTGAFSRGLANGNGTLTDASGEVIYTGGFAGGLFDGQGRYTSPEGWVFEGGFSGGLFDGEGSIVTGDGETIRGIWERGVQTTRYG